MANQSTPKTFVYSTVGTGTFTVPFDWNNKNNKVEVIGGGGGASVGVARYGGAGGGGGAYSQANNVILVAGASAFYQVGAGGAGGRTAQSQGANGTNSWFNTTASAQPTTFGLGNVVAYFGERGNTAAGGTVCLGGAGGAATVTVVGASQIANVSFAGGAGANTVGSLDFGGGGGGSAGSLYGTGFRGGYSGSSGGGGGGGGGVKGVGGNNSTTTSGAGGANATSVQAATVAAETDGNSGVNGGGGSGGGGATGANATAGKGGEGGVGKEYVDSVTGEVEGASGGGGGGGGASASTGTSRGGGNANTGGGGGAAGGGRGTSNTISGNGGSGLVVITYLPSYMWVNTVTQVAGSANTNSYFPNNAGNSSGSKTKAWWANTSTLRNQTNATSYFVNNAGNSSGSKTKAWWANTSTLRNQANVTGSAVTIPVRIYPNDQDGYIANTNGSTLTLSGNVRNPNGFVITFPSAYDGYFNDGGSFVGIGGYIDIDKYEFAYPISAPVSYEINLFATGVLESSGVVELSFDKALYASGNLSTTSSAAKTSQQKSWEANTSTLRNQANTSGAAATLKCRVYVSPIPTGSVTTSGAGTLQKDRNVTPKGTLTLAGPGETQKADGSRWIYFENAYEPSDQFPALQLSGSAIIGAKVFNIIPLSVNRTISGTLRLSGAAQQTDYTSGATYKFLYPNTDIQVASWYNSDDTQTNMNQYIDEEDAIDSDYIWTNTLNSEYIVRLDTTARIIKRNGWSINFRAGSPDGTNIILTTTFYSGTTAIASWNDTLGSVLTFIKHDLTSAEIQTLPADGSVLRVGFKISQG